MFASVERVRLDVRPEVDLAMAGNQLGSHGHGLMT
jgi:hypothetical protein